MKKIYRRWVLGTGDVSSRTENSEGKFWEKLRFTNYCNARRRSTQAFGEKPATNRPVQSTS